MKVELSFRDTDARMLHYLLKKHYSSKANLVDLIKKAAGDIAAEQARKELDEAMIGLQPIDEKL